MKFYGEIGYAGDVVEYPPGSGVTIEVPVERHAYGDVIRNSRQLQANGEHLNDDITVNNSISVVADGYAFLHFFAIRYVLWQGARWKVVDVTVERPRLILRLGGIYNGATPLTTTDNS